MSFFLLLMFLVVIATFIFVRLQKKREQQEILNKVSLLHGGAVHGGSIFKLPTLTIPYKASTIIVKSWLGAKSATPSTELLYAMKAGRDMTMSISTEFFLCKAFSTVRMRRIETGNGEFDEAFVVKGDDESAVISLLTPSFQQKLLDVSESDTHLTVENNEIRLAVTRLPMVEEEYDPLIDVIVAVVDAMEGEPDGT